MPARSPTRPERNFGDRLLPRNRLIWGILRWISPSRRSSADPSSSPLRAISPVRCGGTGTPRASHRFQRCTGWAVCFAVAAAAIPVSAAEPTGLAVLPFESARGAAGEGWLARFLQESLRDSLLRSGGGPVMPPETAAQWRLQLQLRSAQPPTSEQLKEMGVAAAVGGTVHLVLSLAEVRVYAQGPEGKLLSAGPKAFRLNLAEESPPRFLARLLEALRPALFPDREIRAAPQPKSWEPLRAFYSLRLERAKTGEATAKRLAALDALAAEPALAGPVNHAKAALLVEEAQLRNAGEAARTRHLRAALEAILASIRAEPWQTDRLALKGEIHFFLREDFQAKTEASIARIRNPLNGLAYAVLGMVAGLSTGEADLRLRQALKVDPFFEEANRAPGAPAYQGGVLEPFFVKWRKLRAAGRFKKIPRYAELLREGEEYFQARRWEEALLTYEEAAEMAEDDYTPALFLARLLIETGRPDEAARNLTTLATEFPNQAEIYFFQGIALEQTGHHREAMEAFRKTLVEAPEHPEGLLHFASAAMTLERWDEAREPLDALLRDDPTHFQGWLNFGIVLAQQEEWEAADEALGTALKIDPDSEPAAAWLERVRRKLRN